MIYLFQELDLISNELLHQIIFSMPVARREYVLHFKQLEDQKRSALAWLLLRYGLKQEYGFREIPDFQKTSSGKPFFRGENMPFFNDRAYMDDLSLVPRGMDGAMITDEDEAIRRCVKMIKEGKVTSVSGKELDIKGDTLCVHGDGAKALAFVRRIRDAFEAEGIQINNFMGGRS